MFVPLHCHFVCPHYSYTGENMQNPEHVMITNDLPSILIGGAPDAGKSVLTYNLTRKLRELDIPHYVFRANPDGLGDWYFKLDDNVRELINHKEGKWSSKFRDLVCREIPRRLLPLIVDIGGLPQKEDTCIFRACTHSLLLVKDNAAQPVEIWRKFMSSNNLQSLAEIRSQLEGESVLTSRVSVITGTMTGMVRGRSLHNEVFDTLVNRICQLFLPYPEEELEKRHLDAAPPEAQESVVHLRNLLAELAPDTDEWTPDLLQPLLCELPTQKPLAVYERGANWVYGALALYALTLPFYQFDSCLGWRQPPLLQSSLSVISQELIQIDLQNSANTHIITIRLLQSYLDYEEATQLVIPEPSPNHGVIVNGQLPLWLFTALARFYAQRNVSWIALNDASTRKPVVIWSRVDEHFIGEELDTLSM
jgi:CRISPR-associated protein Csx3